MCMHASQTRACTRLPCAFRARARARAFKLFFSFFLRRDTVVTYPAPFSTPLPPSPPPLPPVGVQSIRVLGRSMFLPTTLPRECILLHACIRCTDRKTERERERERERGKWMAAMSFLRSETRVRILVHLNSLFFFRQELPSYVTLAVCIASARGRYTNERGAARSELDKYSIHLTYVMYVNEARRHVAAGLQKRLRTSCSGFLQALFFVWNFGQSGKPSISNVSSMMSDDESQSKGRRS
jgi:hypothetical protein